MMPERRVERRFLRQKIVRRLEREYNQGAEVSIDSNANEGLRGASARLQHRQEEIFANMDTRKLLEDSLKDK